MWRGSHDSHDSQYLLGIDMERGALEGCEEPISKILLRGWKETTRRNVV
jgi:hypothetical protein